MFSYRISWSWSVLSGQKNDHQPLHGVPLPDVFLSPIGLIHLSLSCVPYVDSANHPSGPYKHHVVHLGVLLKSVLLLFFCSLRLCCFHRASGRTPSEKIEIRPAGLHLEGQCYDRQEVLLSNRALWCITSTLWKTKTGYCCWDFFLQGFDSYSLQWLFMRQLPASWGCLQMKTSWLFIPESPSTMLSGAIHLGEEFWLTTSPRWNLHNPSLC